MKSVVIIKLFLVLCCNTQNEYGQYVYEVKEIDNQKIGGVYYTHIKYNDGDTIQLKTIINIK